MDRVELLSFFFLVATFEFQLCSLGVFGNFELFLVLNCCNIDMLQHVVK